MCQSPPVYHESPALALLEPWMLARLPKVVDPAARAHIIQLAAGISTRALPGYHSGGMGFWCASQQDGPLRR